MQTFNVRVLVDDDAMHHMDLLDSIRRHVPHVVGAIEIVPEHGQVDPMIPTLRVKHGVTWDGSEVEIGP